MAEITILEIPIEIWAVAGPFAGGLIGAGLSGLVSWLASSNRIKADLKASTRLEWIKEVRQLTAVIIGKHHSYLALIIKYSDNFEKISNSDISTDPKLPEHMMNAFNKESREILNSVSQDINLYKLYFATKSKIKSKKFRQNEDNIKMHDLVDDVFDQLVDFEKHFVENKNIMEIDDDNNIISSFRNSTSDYIKKEWDKAKKNK